MICSNCGKDNASIKYTYIINGKETKLNLCEECAKKLGIEDKLDFNMPISYTNFFSDLFEDDDLLPEFVRSKDEKCPKCGLTYDQFLKSGKFGCSECYEFFSNKIDSLLKSIHGTDKHVGKAPKKILNSSEDYSNEKTKTKVDIHDKKQDSKEQMLDNLKSKLQEAIKEERYEDAAKLRDEIKELSK